MLASRLVCGLLWSLFAAGLSAQTVAPSQGPAEPGAVSPSDFRNPQLMLTKAAQANDLDTLSHPWHMKASYQVFGQNGSPIGTDTLEEWHLAANRWKRSYSSDTLHQNEYQTDAGRFIESATEELPWIDQMAANELVQPVNEIEAVSAMDARIQKNDRGTIHLVCITPGPSGPGSSTSYCLPPQKMFFGNFQDVRNQIAEFHGVFVPREITVTDGGKPRLVVHLQTLEDLSGAQAAAVSFSDAVKSVMPDEFHRPDGMTRPRFLRGPNIPSGIPFASRRVVAGSGMVVTRVVIGTDGHTRDTNVISSPDNSLSELAVAAIKGYVFEPSHLNGKAVETEIIVMTNFHLK